MLLSMRAFPLAGVSALASMFPLPALGQEDASEKGEAVVAPSVVVSATRSEEPLAALPVSASVIQGEDIVESSSRAVDDALRATAGVQLPLSDSAAILPLQPSIAVRGMGVGDTATRALVLLDGLPINGAFFGNVLWNRAPRHTIERVEVVRGASSSLFGSYAIGGVVNIVTRPSGPKEGVAEVQYGEQNTLEGNLWYGQAVNEAVALGFNANYYDTDGYDPFPSDQLQPVNEKVASTLYNLQGRADFKFSTGATGFLRLGYNNQDWQGQYRLQEGDFQIPDIAGGVSLDLGERQTLGIKAFYAHEDFQNKNVSVPDPNTSFVSNAHETTSDDLGMSIVWSKGLAGLVSGVTAGIDYRHIEGQDDQDIFNAPGLLAGTVLGGGTQDAYGVFGEASLTPTPNTEILLNLRFDHFTDTDGRIVTNGVRQTFDDRTFDVVSGRLAGRYQLGEPVAVRASYYTGFRAPTLAERYRSFETPTFRGLSNPDLTEERVNGGDVGLELQHGRLAGQINGFYSELEDFVGSAEVGFVGGKFTVQNANVAAIVSQGVELIGTMALTQTWSLLLNYTYTDSEVTEGPFTGNMNEGTPLNMLGLTVSYRVPSRMSFDLRGRWLSDSYQDISNTALQEEHFVVDLFASYQVKRSLELYLSATNLFDEQYVADGFGQTLGAPRQVSAGLRVYF
jgi:outer membrane receptor protein involved in Fe transport